MRITFAIVVMAWASAVGAFSRPSTFGAPEEQTVRSGVYTDAQAIRGGAVYAQKCASCHGANLDGVGQAPPLAGKDFTDGWIDLTAGDLFERIRISMPADSPGSLRRPDVADVLAFMLSKSAYPSGPSDLLGDVTALKTITFVKQKP